MESFKIPDNLKGKEKAAYIWTYYKIPIVSVVLALSFVVWFFVHRVTTPSDNWFYATFANTYAEAGEGSGIWEDFVSYAGFDVRQKNVYFNNTCFFDPHDEGYNPYYTYFVAYVEAGTLDVILMEKEDLAALGEKGWLMDLNDARMERIRERYRDRLVYAVPADETYGTEPVPVGIDLSGTDVMTRYHIYEDDCAVGISMNCPHTDAVEMFLQFLTAGG